MHSLHQLRVFTLAFVIGAGLLWEKVDGKRCLVCDTPSECHLKPNSLSKTCNYNSSGTDYCLKVWNSHKGVRRACLPDLDKKKADCAFEKISTGKGNLRCFNESEYWGTIHDCYVGPTWGFDSISLLFTTFGYHIDEDTDEKICYCKGDNCNDDSVKIEGFDFPTVKLYEKGECYSQHCQHCGKLPDKKISCPTSYCRTSKDYPRRYDPKIFRGCGPWSDDFFNLSRGFDGVMQPILDCYNDKGDPSEHGNEDGCRRRELVKECLEKISPGFGNASLWEGKYEQECICKGDLCNTNNTSINSGCERIFLISKLNILWIPVFGIFAGKLLM